MYLLIHSTLERFLRSSVYLHPTMYLLIPVRGSTIAGSFLFTSHYVSINSAMLVTIRCTLKNLHPTMYLLIPVIIKASLFLNSEALFCLPFKSANRLLILYALNMLEAQQYRHCRLCAYFTLFLVDNQIMKLVKSSSLPQNSLSSHFSLLLLNKMTESRLVLTCGFNSPRNFSN